MILEIFLIFLIFKKRFFFPTNKRWVATKYLESINKNHEAFNSIYKWGCNHGSV